MSLSFPIIKRIMKQLKRLLLPCEEWIYFKIYCGELTLDTLLLEELKAYIQELHADGYISQWFFIRYYDPHHHIRLRMTMENTKKDYEVIQSLNDRLKAFVEDNFIWKIEISTYERELERYIWLDYEVSEQLFCIDSAYYVQSLEYLENNELKFLYNFKGALDFIQLFYPSEKDVLDFIQRVEKSYKQEFNTTKKTQKQLSVKFRSMRATVVTFLENPNEKNHKVLQKIAELKLTDIKHLLRTIEFPKTVADRFSFVSSHIHMNTNRVFATNQRLYEMITYDHLYRYCNSLLRRNKK